MNTGTPKLNKFEHEAADLIAVKENEPLQITVQTLAYPQPVLIWQFKKNQHVTNITNGVTNRHSVNRHTSSLIIFGMKEDNFGVYTIYGSNTVDNINHRINSYHVVAAHK